MSKRVSFQQRSRTMDTSPTHPSVLSEHTFGRDHFSPPPLAQEISDMEMQSPDSHGDLMDLAQRIRNVGEW